MTDRKQLLDNFLYPQGSLNLKPMKEVLIQMVPTEHHEKCSLCPIHIECSAPVVGVGNVEAKVVLVGRNPGRQEDEAGLPFVGRGGVLLDKFLMWAGLSRSDIYITNLVKCYTSNNRVPKHYEINACIRKWLHEELQIIQPKLIVTMGAQACQALAGIPYQELRRNTLCFKDIASPDEWMNGIRLVACLHPGAVLHNNAGMHDFMMDALYVREECLEMGIVGTTGGFTCPVQ